MPGLSRDDGVEGSAARVPLLEFADLDLDPGLPGEVGHPGVHVDAEHVDAGCPVLPSPDAGAAADVQEVGAGADGDDALYQLVGIGRPGPVVPFGVDSERLCYLPQLVRPLLDGHDFDVFTTKPHPAPASCCAWNSPGFERLVAVDSRWVLHLDMDAFFASVEQLTRPTLRGRPVLVGGWASRVVVPGASYEARVFGARSAMPMHQARRMIGVTAVVLPPRGVVYGVASRRVFDTVRALVPVVEQLSFDEAFGEPPELAGASARDVERFCEDL